MAVNPIVSSGPTLDLFSQSTIGVAGSGIVAKHIAYMPDPLDKFATSSVSPIIIVPVTGYLFKPPRPLPGTSSSGGGGTIGYPI